MGNPGDKVYFKVTVEWEGRNDTFLIDPSPSNTSMEVEKDGSLKQSNIAGWVSMWLKDGKMYQRRGFLDFNDNAGHPLVELGAGSKDITEDSFKTYRQFMDLCDKATLIGLHEMRDRIFAEWIK